VRAKQKQEGISMSFEDSRTQNAARPQVGGTTSLASQAAQSRVDTLKSDVGNALERGRSGIADSAQAAGTDLASDVSKLRADIASIQQTMSTFLSQAGGEAARTAQTVGSAVASQIGGVASDMATATTAQVKTFASEMENMARKNPLGTIGVTLLAGIIIGMISRGGKS
jgi:ElaB/YqjD/DUF883 family membrane-anchored ribosome-binding protein